MSAFRASYWKTIAVVVVGACCMGAAAIAAAVFGLMTTTLLIAFGLVLVAALLVIVAGCIVLARDRRAATGRRDLLLACNEVRSELSMSQRTPDWGLRLRQSLRDLLGIRSLLVGDWVRIRSFEEIRVTLDASGCLDALPFMREMERYCGQTAQVFRRVDKIYDYGGAKDLRRMTGAVLLRGLRCDGSDHGGCEAQCYILWKEAWLEPVSAPVVTATAPSSDSAMTIEQPAASGERRYRCQFTDLVAASTRLSPKDIRQDLRPLLAGNITLRAFVVALATRLFNAVQRWRGGIGFPGLRTAARRGSAILTNEATTQPSSMSAARLRPDQWVTVVSLDEIVKTLDKNNKHRGLWFDPDMIKHCGQRFRVAREVRRIIDDRTGQMRVMKTPCIVLEGVNYSGEFLRLCAQEENLYWREAWLMADPAVGQS